MNFHSIQGCRLGEGFVVVLLNLTSPSLLDPLGRKALAKTEIIGHEISIFIVQGLSDEEISVTLYHEVLEAVTVASVHAPDSVPNFNEGDFESAGYRAHEIFGPASSENLNRMLQFYGFREN